MRLFLKFKGPPVEKQVKTVENGMQNHDWFSTVFTVQAVEKWNAYMKNRGYYKYVYRFTNGVIHKSVLQKTDRHDDFS